MVDKIQNNNKIYTRINIIFACGDIPNIGGAATNTYNLLKLFKDDNQFNPIGLFISKIKSKNINPDNLKNIYHINFDENIEENTVLFKKNIIDKYKKIHIVFCKNYKVSCIMNKIFPESKIIFSPSGLRYLTSLITKKNNYYNNLKDYTTFFNYNITSNKNLFKFININDRFLDTVSLLTSDNILPNSLLSYNILKESFGNKINYKLNKPIYLSNININNDNKVNKLFSTRKYDIAFICYNWNRKCKNYVLVKELIKNKLLKKYKIVIIGINQNEIYDSNRIISFKQLSKNDILNIYQDIKTVVIPSKYDSNPNVLTEAVSAGCNVVTSTNVGNHEYLDKHLIVKNENKTYSWISTILNSLKKKFEYTGPNSHDIKKQLVGYLNKILNNKSCVGIYNIPNEWKYIFTTQKYKNGTLGDFDLISDLNILNKYISLNNNVFFNSFLESLKNYKINYSHFIIINTKLKKPILFINNNINIWILNSINALMCFNRADYYLLNNDYPTFLDKFFINKKFVILSQKITTIEQI